MTHDLADVFERHRPHAFRVAYQMLGSASEAEDVVQEAWLRWSAANTDEIRSPRAWLTTVVTRLSINHLESAKVRRERYFGTWLPEPISTDRHTPPDAGVELGESLSLAFLVLLESLSPTERAVFLLHEAFGMRHREIATILDTTEANSRQVLHRARIQVRARRPRFEPSEKAQRDLLDRFQEATRSGHVERIAELLAADVVAYTDGGGQAPATLLPVFGQDRVARLVQGATQKFVPLGTTSRIARINGQLGIVAWSAGQPLCVISAEVRDGQIQTLFIVTNPDKLSAIEGGASQWVNSDTDPEAGSV